MQTRLLSLPILIASAFLPLFVLCCNAEPGLPNSFTRLEQLPAPKIVASAEAYPGGHHDVGNITDGKPQTEYSSNAKGTNTFIEFDFGAPVSVAAFRHVDRNDPATITASELRFLDAAGAVVGTVPVKHVNQRGGRDVPGAALAGDGPARALAGDRVGRGYGTVGGAEIAFFTAGQAESLPSGITLEAGRRRCWSGKERRWSGR